MPSTSARPLLAAAALALTIAATPALAQPAPPVTTAPSANALPPPPPPSPSAPTPAASSAPPPGDTPPPAPPRWRPPPPTLPEGWDLPPPPPRPRPRWYGWQILIPGIISDAAVVTGILAQNVAPTIIGVAGHLFAPPIVHLAHHQVAKAGISFLIEGIVPGIFVGLGIATIIKCADTSCSSNSPGVVAVEIALPLTWIGGMAADTAALAWEKKSPRDEASSKAPPFSLAPLVARPLHEGASGRQLSREIPLGLSVVGQF